jgi:carboxypeptidase Q
MRSLVGLALATVSIVSCATDARCPPPVACPVAALPAASVVSTPARGPLEVRYSEVAQRIQQHALGHRDAFRKLTVLADDIGHRLSGSKALDDAIAWAVRELERDGHEAVHTEKVMVPVWRRGTERGALLEPLAESVKVLGLGGTIATPAGGVDGDVVVVRSFEELEKRADEVRGAIVLYDVALPPFDEEKGSGYGDVVKYRSEGPSRASALGAKAVFM